MTDTTTARAIAAQLIDKAIKRIDCEVACDHIVGTMGEDIDVDTLAFDAEFAVQRAQVSLTWEEEAVPLVAWEIRRGGDLLHAAASRGDAETIGQLLIRAEVGDFDLRITWYCPACDGDYVECPACEVGTPGYLSARGVLTERSYSIERAVG